MVATIQQQLVNSVGSVDMTYPTIGIVCDTNDPLESGRLRVICPSWGDDIASNIEDLPWATYVTPFGGAINAGTRGAGDDATAGHVSYGFWSIPKIGAQVLVMCLNGDRNIRVWLGCVYKPLLSHTMPHGRYFWDTSHQKFPTDDVAVRPQGPLSTKENDKRPGWIEPMRSNFLKAFQSKPLESNYEWQTRVADNAVSGISKKALGQTWSRAPDDNDVPTRQNGKVRHKLGYRQSRVDPDRTFEETGKNYDSQVYAWTTPGFHAISMDDSQDNCRIRIRSVGGHQIIFDDTNERIYLATAEGRNWIEIDQKGNIDVYTDNKLNVRAKQGINLTSDKDVRIHAARDIHLYAGGEMRTHVKKDVHTRVEGDVNERVYGNVSATVQGNLDEYVVGSVGRTTLATLDVYAADVMKLTTSTSLNIRSGSTAAIDSSALYLNSGMSSTARQSPQAQEQPAKWTHRVPDHEPWGRVMTKDDFTHAPMVPYSSDQNGKLERDDTVGDYANRGDNWRR